MDIIYPHEGQVVSLDNLFDDASVITAYNLRLFTSNTTPTVDSVYADFTIATTTTFPGYATKNLTRGSWTITQGSGVTPSYCTYATQTFTPTGTPDPAASIYGYLITRGLITITIVAAARFDSPILVTSGNDIIITPRIELGDWEA